MRRDNFDNDTRTVAWCAEYRARLDENQRIKESRIMREQKQGTFKTHPKQLTYIVNINSIAECKMIYCKSFSEAESIADKYFQQGAEVYVTIKYREID